MKKRKQTPHIVDFSHKYMISILWDRISSNFKERLNKYAPGEIDTILNMRYSIIKIIKKLKVRDL